MEPTLDRAGIPWADIKAMQVGDLSGPPWRAHGAHVHLACGKPAYLHPYTNSIWGCPHCKFTTEAVSEHFGRPMKPFTPLPSPILSQPSV